MRTNLALTTAYREWNQRRRGPENNVSRVAPFLSALILVGNTSADRGVDHPRYQTALQKGGLKCQINRQAREANRPPWAVMGLPDQT